MQDEILIKQTGGIGLIRFIFRHWYLVLFLLVTLPMFISSVRDAVNTQNYAYPIIDTGLRIANADGMLYQDIQNLEQDPAKFVGMEKPEVGIYKTFIYYWKFFWNVIWRIFGTLFLISLPFVTIYKLLSYSDTSSPAKNLTKAIIFALIFMFFMNLLIMIHGLIKGTLILSPPDAGILQEFWWIVKQTAPFHGVASLLIYAINIFR